jgi:hypothetical protein
MDSQLFVRKKWRDLEYKKAWEQITGIVNEVFPNNKVFWLKSETEFEDVAQWNTVKKSDRLSFWVGSNARVFKDESIIVLCLTKNIDPRDNPIQVNISYE